MIRLALKKRLFTSDGDITLDVNFDIGDGEFSALFGQSGVGKTTLLRIIAGLTTPDEGTVTVNGETWFDSSKGINLPPQRRKVGFVFQDYALFPNMSVRGNIEFALRDKKDKLQIVNELINLMNLTELQHRKPESLSGGQRQRVALARALAGKPKVLLLDEPLSALDASTRLRLQDEILKLHRLLGVTTLLVSHDLSEVFKLCERVLVLEKGQVIKSGKPSDVFADNRASGKFQLTGDVLEIERSDVVFVVTVLVGNQIAKVIATESDISDIRIGDKVMLLSKAFNPMLMKLA